MKIFIPPIKSQGIKTKLVEWISSNVKDVEYDRWVEPFMGTGVVAFNIRPQRALLCDNNPHLIKFKFYKSLQNKEITSGIVRKFLETEGQKLLDSNGEYYYDVRNRFNETGNPLDFLFLSRSCFIAQALVTKITNQVENISQIIEQGDYEFKQQDFQRTLSELKNTDFVYADPPYIGRNVDYFDSWSEENELLLNKGLENSNSKFILSTWLSNKYRTNDYIFSIWKNCYVATKEHFYHLGGKESNRNAVYEALLSNIQLKDSISNSEMKLRIQNEKSLLTSSSKKHNRAKQMILNFDEKVLVI